MKRHFIKLDWILIFSILILCIIGLLMIYSNNFGIPGLKNNFPKQIVWISLGFIVIFGLSFFDYRFLKNNSSLIVLIYLLSVFSLISVLFLGKEVRGAESWFSFKGINFEPVELAKISVLILFAKYFSNRHIEMYRLRHIFISGLYTFVPFLFVLIQPDLGSAIIIFSIWLSIVIFAGIKTKHFLAILLIGAVISVFAWTNFLTDQQKARIIGFLYPEDDPQGIGYHKIQSVTAVGAGKLFGLGFGRGLQTHSQFLPESTTDFIFASIAEEWGFTGCLILIFIFSILIWRIVKIGIESPNNFTRFFSLGLALYIFIQTSINLGMNLGILPITGISLPFVSYGGSNLITLCLAIGILQNIKTQNPLKSETYIYLKTKKLIDEQQI